MKQVKILNYHIDEFARLAPIVWPGTTPPPTTGCIKAVFRWLKENGLTKKDLISQIRKAGGDRAIVIFYAHVGGWWPKTTAVKDIREAPGDRARAIFWAVEEGWWPQVAAVRDIRGAPGNRAWAIYMARYGGWWPQVAAVRDIRTAPRASDRATVIRWAKQDGWWTDERTKPCHK